MGSYVYAVWPSHRALLLIQERLSEVVRVSQLLEQPRLASEVRDINLSGVSVGELQAQAPVTRDGNACYFSVPVSVISGGHTSDATQVSALVVVPPSPAAMPPAARAAAELPSPAPS